MIQRIQSIFLVLAAFTMSLLYIGPLSFATIFGDASALKAAEGAMLADGTFEVGDHIILQVLSMASILLPLIILVLYKNRTRQMTLSRLTLAVLILLLVLSILLFVKDYNLMSEGTEVTIEYGYVTPLVSLILVFLALRYIKKDDKLVRSADRLR